MTFMFSRASAHPRSIAETFFRSRDRKPGFTRDIIEYCINIRTAATEREIPRQIAVRYVQHDRIIGNTSYYYAMSVIQHNAFCVLPDFKSRSKLIIVSFQFWKVQDFFATLYSSQYVSVPTGKIKAVV